MPARIALFATLLPLAAVAQSGRIDPAAAAGIAAGNRAWIDAMKQGNPKLVAATYSEDAVDCSAAGDCVRGRAAIERQIADRIGKLGRASSASVTSEGSVQNGSFVYEWGRAEAVYPNGSRVAGRYLTIWRKSGATWLIFRNLKIPPAAAH